MKITEPSIEIREKTKSVKPTIINYDALPDLRLFLLFTKREKHLSRNHRGGTILLIKFQAAAWQPGTLLRVTLMQIAQSITIDSIN